jgi:predicted N-acetyltransferase YhbS
MDDIRRGTPQDFAEVMERVVASFRERHPSHGRFEELYPDTILSETMEQWWLARVGGEIVAGIQLVPRAFVLAGEVSLRGVGLGNVFCYPPFRKHGLMSALLDRGNAEMARGGIGICILGGDRTRYGNYGWEHAGAERALTLAACVTRFEDSDSVSAVDLRVWNGDAGDLRRILAAYSALPYRTERGVTECARVLRRPGQVVWICERSETGFGYASVCGNAIAEYGGDPVALERIVTFLLRSGTWSVALPPVDAETALEKLLLRHAQSYVVRPAGMLRIVSMQTVLEAYRPLLRARLEGWTGDIVLRSTDTGETVRISADAGVLEISEARPDTVAVELTRRELAQLFFGPFAPDIRERSRHGGIRRLLPLPFYCHALAHV